MEVVQQFEQENGGQQLRHSMFEKGQNQYEKMEKYVEQANALRAFAARLGGVIDCLLVTRSRFDEHFPRGSPRS